MISTPGLMREIFQIIPPEKISEGSLEGCLEGVREGSLEGVLEGLREGSLEDRLGDREGSLVQPAGPHEGIGGSSHHA